MIVSSRTRSRLQPPSMLATELQHHGEAFARVTPSDAPLVSDELELWLAGHQPKTLGNIVELFGRRSFAVVFVLLRPHQHLNYRGVR